MFDSKVAKGVIGDIKLLQSSLPAHLASSSNTRDRYTTVKLTKEAKQLIKRIHYSLQQPQLSYSPHIHLNSLEVCTDASDHQAGISNRTGTSKHTLPYEGDLWEKCGLTLDSKIYLKELYAILAALKLAPRNCNLRIWCDNETIIFGLASGGGTDSTYRKMVSKFYSICTAKNITAVVAKVNSDENPADDPSRKTYKPLDLTRTSKCEKVFEKPREPISR